MSDFGCRTMTEPLRRVLVRRPSARAAERWEEYGWRSAPDPGRLAAEHEAFCDALQRAGAEVLVADALDDDPDAVYAFDPCLVTEHGALLLRPGKEGRRREVDAVERDLERLGVPVVSRIEADASAEGGDLIRLDERTLLAGRGYRTTDNGIAAIQSALPSIDVRVFDLPYWHGEGEVMHLLSLLSPLDVDLAVGYLPLLPVRLAELLAERGIEVVPVPHDELETMGTNVLALAPRVALCLEGNDETRRRLEAAGVDVVVYRGDELSLKGDGGPTCLTMPVLRA